MRYFFTFTVLISTARTYLVPPSFSSGGEIDRETALYYTSIRWFTQPLDHFDDNNSATWQQKYFENDAFCDMDNKNVAFITIGGEGAIVEEWMAEGEWVENARKFKAILFNLEHRFYGESRPTKDLSVQNLKYLTIEQALADIAAFITAMQKEYNLSPDVKWIAFGSSYSGSLAAWARLKYPQLIQGVVSSSAPLLVVPNYPEFYEVVFDNIRKFNEQCYNAVEEALNQVESLLQNKRDHKSLSNIFNLCPRLEDSTDVESDSDCFTYYLSTLFGLTAQYNEVNGNKVQTFNKLCYFMIDPLEPKEIKRLANLNIYLSDLYNESCTDYKYSRLIESFKYTTWDKEKSERQWTFQTCNEVGLFTTSDAVPQLFRNRFPLDFFIRQCTDVFGPEFNRSRIEQATNRINRLYGGLNINVSNVVFVHGSRDPWYPAGVKEAVNPDSHVIFIEGMAHGANIYSPHTDDLPQLRVARAQITRLIHTWLSF